MDGDLLRDVVGVDAEALEVGDHLRVRLLQRQQVQQQLPATGLDAAGLAGLDAASPPEFSCFGLASLVGRYEVLVVCHIGSG